MLILFREHHDIFHPTPQMSYIPLPPSVRFLATSYSGGIIWWSLYIRNVIGWCRKVLNRSPKGQRRVKKGNICRGSSNRSVPVQSKLSVVNDVIIVEPTGFFGKLKKLWGVRKRVSVEKAVKAPVASPTEKTVKIQAQSVPKEQEKTNHRYLSRDHLEISE